MSFKCFLHTVSVVTGVSAVLSCVKTPSVSGCTTAAIGAVVSIAGVACTVLSDGLCAPLAEAADDTDIGVNAARAADAATSVVEAGGYTNADLEASANAMDRNGLTRAGRALQKHGDRPGSVFPRSTGSAEARNAQGIDQVNAILNDPNRTVDVLNKVINIYGSNGAGVRYSVGGDFMGFLEP
jgi:hypothetical protein